MQLVFYKITTTKLCPPPAPACILFPETKVPVYDLGLPKYHVRDRQSRQPLVTASSIRTSIASSPRTRPRISHSQPVGSQKACDSLTQLRRALDPQKQLPLVSRSPFCPFLRGGAYRLEILSALGDLTKTKFNVVPYFTQFK